MKVTYYYRPHLQFGYSIEGVFDIVKNVLKHKLFIEEYYCTTKFKRLSSLLTAGKFQGDVNHITGDAHFLFLALDRRKTVLTIHDIGHYERSLKGIKKRLFKIFWFDIPMRRVARITTISEFTKRQLLKYVNIEPEKIKVIYNPAPSDFPRADKVFNHLKPKILQIGSGSQKNLQRLIEAITGLNFELILVRKKDIEIENDLKRRGISFQWYQNLSREELYNCYKESDILFFASEYEGFGVPILEANCVGRPIITSNLSSMPEVAGNSALLIDPFDVSQIRMGLETIKNDDALRHDLVTKGFENVKKFSAERISNEYFLLYSDIANRNLK